MFKHATDDEGSTSRRRRRRFGKPRLVDDEARARRATRRRRAAMKTIAVLPTLFTLGNLLCGFLAVFVASKNPETTKLMMGWTPLTWAGLLIFLGMLFDALDGRIARLTGQTSELGGQLDSMADMVTFGVAPAYLVIQLIGIETPFFADRADHAFDRVALVVAGIYVACAALRLARFNIESTSHDVQDHMSFKGMPSPGAAGTVVSLVLLHQHYLAHQAETLSRVTAVAMVPIALIVAMAMVSRLRYVHAMNRYVKGRAPFMTIVKLVILGLLLLIWPQVSLAVAFVVYALSAPVFAVVRRAMGRKDSTDAADDESIEDDESADETEDDALEAQG